jgi:hypothetical protein
MLYSEFMDNVNEFLSKYTLDSNQVLIRSDTTSKSESFFEISTKQEISKKTSAFQDNSSLLKIDTKSKVRKDT